MSERTAAMPERLQATLAAFETGRPGEPHTTSEVAAQLDVSRRSTYERLDTLADRGLVETKKVGAKGRVWWRPVETTADDSGAGDDERADDASDPSASSPGANEHHATDPDRRQRRERAFARSVLDNQHDIVYAIDREGNFLRWNDRLQAVTGYDEATVADIHALELVAPNHRAAAADAVQDVFDGESTTIEAPLVTADGETIPYEFTGSPITDTDGDVVGMTGIGRDVSDRARWERQLERQRDELERELKDVFTRIDDAFYGLDDEFRFTYVNDRAEDLLQRAEEDLLGESVWDVFPEATETDAWDALHTALDEQVQTGYETYFEPLEFRVEASVYPSESGLSVYFRDVTERRERERRLEQYEQIVETVGDGIYALDENDEFVIVNDALCELTGYDREELIGSKATRLYDASHTPEIESRAAAVAAGVADVARIELDAVTADGDAIPCETRLAPFSLGDGETGRCGVVRDVSDRKAHERDLARFKEAVEASGHAIFMADLDGQITYANSAFEELTGYAADEVVGESPAALGSERRDDEYYGELWATVGGGDVWEEEIVDRRQNGDVYYAEQTVAPVTDDAGEITQYVAVQREVTERKLFEERLKVVNEVARDLLTAARDVRVDEVVVDTVADLFDLPGAVVYTYDEASDRLVPGAQSVDASFMRAAFSPIPLNGSSLTERVFDAGAPRYYEDVTESGYLQGDAADTEMRTGMFVPLGERGILVVGAREVDAFDADTRQLIELLAANAEAAWVRVDRERELERRIRQQTVVTDLGQQALEGRGVDALMGEAAERLTDALDADYCEVLDFDEDGETLRLREGVGWDDGLVGEATVSAVAEDSQAAYTLAVDEPVVVDDLATETCFDGPAFLTDHGVRSGISVVVGPADDPWGILGAFDADPRQFSAQDVTVVQSVATVLATAITRRADEQALVRQREQLAALNSLNEVVREISDAVIDQSTREEIEAVVCEHLAETTSYAFAWIGEVDHPSQTVRLRAEAGVENYLDGVTISVDPEDERSRGATGRAFRTGETQTTHDVRTDPRYEPWRDHAEDLGYLSSAAVPITYEGTSYGVLNIYADRPYALTGRERSVVDQLGEVVGHAIAAVERKRALMTDEVVELGFHIPDVFAMVGRDPVDGTVTIDQTVPISDEAYLAYGAVRDGGEAVLEALVDALDHWETATVRGGCDGGGGADSEAGDDAAERAFELRVTDPPVLSAVASGGGTLDEAVIDDGTYHMTLQVPPGSEVRQVIDAVQGAYPDAEMVTRRQTTRDHDPAQRATIDVGEHLTDRQRAALRAAYNAGFFEWPRTASGEEVAEALGVSAPTFHQHLRKAEGKVLDAVIGTLR